MEGWDVNFVENLLINSKCVESECCVLCDRDYYGS